MNINPESYIILRKGIMEHLDQGKMNGREFSVYAAIHFWCDFRYGIAWKMSSVFLKRFLNEKEATVKKCLTSLSSKGYIKRFNHRGQRTYYPILIDNFQIKSGIFTRADKTLSLDNLCIQVRLKGTLIGLKENFKCPLKEIYVSPIKEVNKLIFKEVKNITPPETEESPETKIQFNTFWDKYHSITNLPKTDFQPAIKKWNRLSKLEQTKAIEKIETYFDANKNYPHKARTYLGDKHFNDEFSAPKNESEIKFEMDVPSTFNLKEKCG